MPMALACALALLLALTQPLAASYEPPGACEDKLADRECQEFASMGECRGRRRNWMRGNCAHTCGFCQPQRSPSSAQVAGSQKQRLLRHVGDGVSTRILG